MYICKKISWQFSLYIQGICIVLQTSMGLTLTKFEQLFAKYPPQSHFHPVQLS